MLRIYFKQLGSATGLALKSEFDSEIAPSCVDLRVLCGTFGLNLELLLKKHHYTRLMNPMMHKFMNLVMHIA